jgi:hypothetical protein
VQNFISPTINPDDLLNGSFTGPVVSSINSGLAQLPRTAGAGFAAAGPQTVTPGSSNAVLYAWIGLFVLLVATHMITLSVQR